MPPPQHANAPEHGTNADANGPFGNSSAPYKLLGCKLSYHFAHIPRGRLTKCSMLGDDIAFLDYYGREVRVVTSAKILYCQPFSKKMRYGFSGLSGVIAPNHEKRLKYRWVSAYLASF